MRRHEGTVLTDRCINVTTVMDVSQLYGATWQYVVTYNRLCRVVKHKSCETYWILLGWLMTTHVSFEVTVPSTFDSHKLSSWKVIHHCELWLSMSTGLRPQTTCVVKSHTAVDAQHVRWSSEWPIDHNSFLFVSSHIYTINCSHLQPICMCF